MPAVLYLTDKWIEQVFNDSEESSGRKERVLWSDTEGMTELARELTSSRSVRVVLDLVEESQVVQWAPKLYWWERDGYEKNLVKKLSAEGVICSGIRWVEQYRQSEDGRQEQLNIVSRISGPKNFGKFLQILEAFHVPVQEISPYVMLLERLFFKEWAPRLGWKKSQITSPFMLIIQESSHRCRQLLFLAGRFALDRHIVIEHRKSGPDIRQSLIDEVLASVRYFSGQSLLAAEVPGMIYLGNSDLEAKEVTQSYRHAQSVSGNEAAIPAIEYLIIGLKNESPESRIVRAFSTLKAKIHPPGFYYPPFVVRVRRYARARVAVLGMTFMMALFSLFYAGKQAVEIIHLKQNIGQMKQAILSGQETRAELQTLEHLKYEARSLISAGLFAKKVALGGRKAVLGIDLSELSQVLDRHEHIGLSGLDWHKTSKSKAPEVVVKLEGHVFPFHERYKPLMEWVDRLVSDFKRQSYVHSVKLARSPLANSERETPVSIYHAGAKIKALPFLLELHLESADVSR